MKETKYAGTQTEKNLMAAFAGESEAVSYTHLNPKYLNRLYLHTVFHCIFLHLWTKGRRDKRLWHLACDIAVENVIDGLGRKSVQRPLSYVRQHAYEAVSYTHL